MSKLFACIISTEANRDRAALISTAQEFAYAIEVLNDGIVFDVSGLERLVGKPDKIAASILEQLQERGLQGSVAVADTKETVLLLARQNKGRHTALLPQSFGKLPLQQLPIEPDTVNVLSDLGIFRVEDLLAVPEDDLIGRYGKDFRRIIDLIEQKGRIGLTPNVKQDRLSWSCELDLSVENFEQLIFLLNRGLEKLFKEIAVRGLSTEHNDIELKLRNGNTRVYEIKASFPTLETVFWLKLINLRVALDPPEAEIAGVRVTSYFTKPRASQRGLYAASRPEPESLLLTLNKLKKLTGEANVGVPTLLDRRLPEPFVLDAGRIPGGTESQEPASRQPTLAFTYYRPPQRAEVVYRDGRLVYIRTRSFDGYVAEYSGVWKESSAWWDKWAWRTFEWDVEVENRGIYRLCRVNRDWFLTGEYD